VTKWREHRCSNLLTLDNGRSFRTPGLDDMRFAGFQYVFKRFCIIRTNLDWGVTPQKRITGGFTAQRGSLVVSNPYDRVFDAQLFAGFGDEV
jgi:hypothetical protein